ncbi:hypothetical protein FRB98_006078 [Tulasnella sp. 332]|nr:hypothetical protein FRB98_006078 [Tulasnella sp. 332]
MDEIASLPHKEDSPTATSYYDMALRTSPPADALHLVHNVLLGQSPSTNKAVIETLARLAFEESIKTVDDVRHISLPAWSNSHRRALTGTVHLALAIRSIRVLVASQALSLLPAAISYFLRAPLEDLDPAFRHVLKQIASLPSGSHIRTQLLLLLLRTAIRRRYNLDRWTYSALLFGKDVDGRLVRTIQKHMAIKAYYSDSSHPRMIRALATSGDKDGAMRLFRQVRKSRRERKTSQKCGVYPLGFFSSKGFRPDNQGITIDNVMFLRSYTDPRELKRYVRHLTGHRRPNGEDSLRYLDSHGWRTYLDQLGALPAVTGKELVDLLHKLETASAPVSVDITMYTSIISSLIQKNMWPLAWRIWERLRRRCVVESQGTAHAIPLSARKWRLDKVALCIGVILLCRYKRDPVKAFTMVHAMASEEENISGNRIPTDTALINQLLEELARLRRTEAIFPIWQDMSRQYGVHRDNGTLVVLLQAATYGSVGGEMDVTSSGVVEEFASTVADGFQRLVFASRRRNRFSKSDTANADVLLGHRVISLLRDAPAPREDVLWDGMIAWQRARLVFLEVIFGNWPGLRKVQLSEKATESVPGTTKPSTKTYFTRPRPAELLHRPSTSPYGSHIEFLSESDPRTIPPVPSTSLYPEITPTDQTFRAYIQLLGEHSLQDQIPQAVAWMRCLAIRPSKNTLVTALAYYREVTEDLVPPLVEAYGKSAGKKNAYATFMRWVQGWVMGLKDDKLMLDEDAVSRAIMKIRRMRESADKWDETSPLQGSQR